MTRRTAIILVVAAALLGTLAYAELRPDPADPSTGGGPGTDEAHDVSGSHPLPNQLH